jgi:transcriptional regulator with XRE-family HTH domain
MKRSPDTFVFPAELGARLRDLRLRAGLTQLGLAQAMGRTGKKAGNLVGRIERGDERYPSFGVIADFLRGCRTGFGDIADILDLYTNLPTLPAKVFGRALVKIAASVPAKWQDQVTDYDLRFDHPKASAKPDVKQTMPDRMKRLERARKMAAAAHRRDLYGQFLMHEVNKTGTELPGVFETMLFNHGLEWFGILYHTRRKRPETREGKLAASEERFVSGSGVPVSAIHHMQDAVRRHFGEMEMRGDLDWLPGLGLDEYEAGLLAPTRKRELKRELHDEYVRKFGVYEAARKAAVEQVWNEAQPLLDETNVPKERRPVYRGAVGACCTAALMTEPGSAEERRQVEEYILEPRWIGLGLDTALAQKLAAIVLARFRELAKSFPPDPRPKR